jgi:membrane-bound serine protease (ClpP class)
MQKLKQFRIFSLLLIVTGLAALAFGGPGAQETGPAGVALVAEVEGPIGPATVRYIDNAIEEARVLNAEVLILRLNTPGGLVVSTREIISAILGSPVPVIGYVAPSGAHAASAGTFIMYATHVAAMAPGTNLGAATPVTIGAPSTSDPAPEEDGQEADDEDSSGDQQKSPSNTTALDRKSMNDAVAWIRSLAEMRGRNADWAEAAVREAASLSAGQALQENVIEIMAVDMETLLRAIDGLEVTLGRDTRVLDTEGLSFVVFEPGLMTRILAILSNPNIALILMMIGVYGIFFEFANPGSIGPGVVGAISLILALYALNQLPLNSAGVILILLGVGFMIAEAFTPTMGALGVGGLVAFIFGAGMLIDTDVPEFQISWPVILGTAAVSAAFLILLMGYVWRAHQRPVASGAEHLVGAEARVLEWTGKDGFVWAQGERWQARGEAPLKPGQKVQITALEGLTMVVGGKKNKPKKGV